MSGQTPSEAQATVLAAMARGDRLKAHRYVDGRKVFRLHPLNGAPQPVRRATVEALVERGWIDSNKKFPAAMYWLTPQGRRQAAALAQAASAPLSPADAAG